jgi:UDP-N-acetylmuramoylalanine--D-glutamate ligase
MDAPSSFAGKKITVMGLGLLGRGIGDTRYLASCGAELIVTDLKTREQLGPALEALSDFSNITYVLGEHRLEDFRGRDMILKAAGVPLDSPYIIEAQSEGIPIKMSASLFAEFAQIPIVGITGTRGKSTTTHMLKSIYEHAGKKFLLGGNVRGVSTLELLSEVTPGTDCALFELDSWQLQGFGEAGISPQFAVFTTFYPDHMNYYHDDLELYFADKANIFLHQKPEDTLVLGAQMAALAIERYGEAVQSRIKIVDAKDLPSDWTLRVPGEHNRYNAALALATARAQGLPNEVIREGLERYMGIPGRLELLRDIDGVSIYNDSNSTTPEATLAGIMALIRPENPKSILLIMGGADKNLDMGKLLQAIPEHVKRVVFLSGTGTDRIAGELPEAEIFQNLAMAFKDAMTHADAGDTILFSPAFASFGMFANEYDRGDQFTVLVQSYDL